MKLFKAIIALSFFSLSPSWINAQQRFEISAGVSSPGFHTWEKRSLLNSSFPEDYRYNKLSAMDDYAYRSTYYPGLSIQAAYKLPDHGFTKRLSVLAYAGLNTAGFKKYDYLTNKLLYSEAAFKFDLMAGFYRDREIDLALAGHVDLAGFGISGIGDVRVLRVFAGQVLGMIDGDSAVRVRLEKGGEALGILRQIVAEEGGAGGDIGFDIVHIVAPGVGRLVDLLIFRSALHYAL